MGTHATSTKRVKAGWTWLPAILGLIWCIAALPTRAATITTIYSFGTLRRNTQRPYTPVTVFRGKIYGEVADGKVFEFYPGHDKLRTLRIVASVDYYSRDGLALLDGALYGFTSDQSGTYSIFKIDPLTGSISIVHTFPGTQDTVIPLGSLAAIDGKLFGTLEDVSGGTLVSTVYSLDPASGAYATLHTQTAAEGVYVFYGLSAHGGLLYGAAQAAGAHDQGTLFQVDPATGLETTIHTFTPSGRIPGTPYSGPIIHGNEAFGFAHDSNSGNYLYRINLKTGGVVLLCDFSQASGAFVNPDLSFKDGLLYGTLADSDAYPSGSIYTVDAKSGVFTTAYAFTGGADGAAPQAG